jgi:lipid-A-disaccharide synthase
LPIHFSINSQEKPSLFQKAKGALAASGTVSLELAHAHVPMVIAYKVSPFTHFILKKIVHTPYVCLVNILLKEPHVPELLQNMCTPHNLHKAMVSILKNPTQDRALKESVKLLQVSHKTPSTIAAHTVLTFIK